ncbi:hypothetical protein BC833DRAFT_582569 [Globomyces pollinis-pini]|nr:hypothetical protein BC833DRAFT_582569 [Globomyces pollinis-pini]
MSGEQNDLFSLFNIQPETERQNNQSPSKSLNSQQQNPFQTTNNQPFSSVQEMFADNTNWNWAGQQQSLPQNKKTQQNGASLGTDTNYVNNLMNNPSIAEVLNRLTLEKRPLFIQLSQQLQMKMITNEQFTESIKALLDTSYTPPAVRQVLSTPGQMPPTSSLEDLKRTLEQSTNRDSAAKRMRMDPNSTQTRQSNFLNPNIQQQQFSASLQRWSSAQYPQGNLTVPVPNSANPGNGNFNRVVIPNGAAPAEKRPEEELDIIDMMDVTNYAGVDLKEEEFSLNDINMQSGFSVQDRHKEVPFLNIMALEKKVLEIAASSSVTLVDPSFTTFLSQAADAYICQLLQSMCNASEQRATVDYEMMVRANGTGDSKEIELDVAELDDVRVQLHEIETRQREELEALNEQLGPRPTEEEIAADTASSVPNTTGATNSVQTVASQKVAPPVTPSTIDGKKPKRQSTKKDLPEAVKNKLTNSAALMAAGGTIKSWMLPGASISLSNKVTSKDTPSKTGGRNGDQLKISSTVRPGSRLKAQKRVTIKDALYAMESQRELKTSDILYKWWANVK